MAHVYCIHFEIDCIDARKNVPTQIKKIRAYVDTYEHILPTNASHIWIYT